MRLIRAFGIIIMPIVFLAAAVPLQATSGFKPIEIRLVAQEPRGGPAVVVDGGEKTLEVEPEVLLGPSDFVSVGEVEWTEGKPGFNVELTPAGAEKYEKVSTANVGRILAIIVDGQIVMTPKILDPVRAQGFLLTVKTEREAKELSAKIRQVITPN
ncbi:hypothetical protein ACC680_32435 [Rhizobium ruizarguesonis]